MLFLHYWDVPSIWSGPSHHGIKTLLYLLAVFPAKLEKVWKIQSVFRMWRSCLKNLILEKCNFFPFESEGVSHCWSTYLLRKPALILVISLPYFPSLLALSCSLSYLSNTLCVALFHWFVSVLMCYLCLYFIDCDWYCTMSFCVSSI